MRRTVESIGEEKLLGLISRWLKRQGKLKRILRGAGDDCATIRQTSTRMLLTCDAMVEGIHFSQAWARPEQIGWKSLAANVSDIAAAGGKPRTALLSLELPGSLKLGWLKALFAGVMRCARFYGVYLAGGNLSRGSRVAVHLSLLGDAPPRLTGRDKARPGDIVAVTGSLGGARAGLISLKRRLGGRDVPAAVRRHLLPRPPLAAGQALARHAHAQIDISDGVLREAGWVARASAVGIILFPSALPVHAAARRLAERLGMSPFELALTSGEEYEILACLPAADFRKIRTRLRRKGTYLTAIGLVRKGRGVTVAGTGTMKSQGWDHFAKS